MAQLNELHDICGKQWYQLKCELDIPVLNKAECAGLMAQFITEYEKINRELIKYFTHKTKI